MQLDTGGSPAVLIATTPLHSTLVATRALYGVPGARCAEVAHPLQSPDGAELHRRPESAVAQLADIVLGR